MIPVTTMKKDSLAAYVSDWRFLQNFISFLSAFGDDISTVIYPFPSAIIIAAT